MKQDKLFISLYNDYYGAMLTQRQRLAIDKYYNQDMSLSEIGHEFGVSPQAVRDTLLRAEGLLINYEFKLGLVAKTNKLRQLLQELAPLASQEQKIEIQKALNLLDE